VLADPQVASVGVAWGDQVVTGVHRIAGRPDSGYGRPKRPGLRGRAAGTNETVIVGGDELGPEAGEWAGQLTLAVRARTPSEILPRTNQPLPSTSDIVSALQALRGLPMEPA
jgi:hypothetical protein